MKPILRPSNYWNRKIGVHESRTYDNSHIKGVHKPYMVYPGAVYSYSESLMGYQMRGMQYPGPCGVEQHWFSAIRAHVDVLFELQAMPKPNLP